MRKMASMEIESAISSLIDELDSRSEDADLEIDADFEPEPEEGDFSSAYASGSMRKIGVPVTR